MVRLGALKIGDGVKDEINTHKSTHMQEALADEVLKEEQKPPHIRASKAEILRRVGYSVNTSNANAAEIYSTKGFIAAMQRRGVLPEHLVDVATGAMQAKKGTFYRGEYIEADKLDHDTALKGAHFMADVLGLKKMVLETHNINVNVNAEDISGLI